MIAAVDPLSPHESSNKDTQAHQQSSSPSTETPSWPVTPAPAERFMSKRKKAAQPSDETIKVNGNNSDASDSSADSDYDDCESDDAFSSGDEDQNSSLKSFSPDSLGDAHADNIAPSKQDSKSAGSGRLITSDGAPVKRILRRKRKRMSEDERRLRHREVQRQFMKRKRARLGGMRMVLRGLESQRRVVQIMNERATLEKQNMEMRVLLASPGSGWQWDDAPIPTSQLPPPQLSPTLHAQNAIVYSVPLPHATYQLSPHPYDHHHIVPHRPHQVPGMPLPWDDILDAVSTDGLSGHFHDISF